MNFAAALFKNSRRRQPLPMYEECMSVRQCGRYGKVWIGMMKNSGIRFIDKTGSFQMENPQKNSYLYFPLAGENGIKSGVTPLLGGDAKIGQNTFLLQPVSAEELHNNRSTRNFWLKFGKGGAWSATGASAETEGLTGTEWEEETLLEAGLMWHQMKRTSKKYELESIITSYVPTEEPAVEMMEVTIRNTGRKSRTFTPVAAVPIYGRSADNLRDHRHVTSLLNRIVTTEYGVYMKPELSFDERGHKINHTGYFVCGVQADRKAPTGTYPLAEDFIGEGGSFTRPNAVYAGKEPLKPGALLAGYEAMGGICFEETVLEAGESRTYLVLMGITEEGPEKGDKAAERFAREEYWKSSLEQTKEYWLSRVNVKYETGSHVFDNWMYWVNFQPILRRIFGCSFLPHHDYGKGGRGWRDLWQDCLALLIMEPGDVRGMLADNYAGVRIDGTNATIIGAGRKEFIADRNNITRVWMDHGVWPFLTTEFYIHQTGDLKFLLEETVYFKDKQAARGTRTDSSWTQEQGVWQLTEAGEEYRGSILEHILLENLSVFFDVGEHGHMLLRGADWNDALDMAHTRGESVAFTAAYAGNLERIAKLCRELKKQEVQSVSLLKEIKTLLDISGVDFDDIGKKRKALEGYTEAVLHRVSGETAEIPLEELYEKLEQMSEWLKEHIRKTEWLETKDGSFYNGYYDDQGRQVEGPHGETTRKMLTGQVFTVMSGTATEKQVKEIIRAVDRDLYNPSVGGYQLNTNFGELKTDLGRMFGFAYGHKENGAVFSHMAVMYANALYQRGFVREGYQVISALHNQAMDFEKSRIYPGIPEYFNDRGRGMYHYLTGAASWMMLTVVTQMFGVRGNLGDLIFDPKLVPEQFDEFGKAAIELEFSGKPLKVTYVLNVRNQAYTNYRIVEVRLNEKKQKENYIPREVLNALDSKNRHEIWVELCGDTRKREEKNMPEGYCLVWEDSFLKDGAPDESKWTHEVGEYWANNEQQAYTDSRNNSFVKDGKLYLHARKETYGIREYTSARINTYGKKSFQYGYFEVKAKLPKGSGSWPAFWFMPVSSKTGEQRWPECGEIDMVEHIGRKQDSIWYSLHSGKHNHTRKDTKQYTEIFDCSGVSEDFHTYGMEWTKDYIEFWYDGKPMHRFSKTDDTEDQTSHSWPYDQPFYFIINIAVGGGLGGEIDEAALPYVLEVDYVKVYEKEEE